METLETEIINFIKERLPGRLAHILGVQTLAVSLAKHYNINTSQTSIAALLHDAGRMYSESEMRTILTCNGMSYPSHYKAALLHANVGVIVAKRDFHITDEDVLLAIKHHTMGRPNMTYLEKIIYVADYLDPSRKIQETDELRDRVFVEFEYVFLNIVVSKINYVLSRGEYLAAETVSLYNSIVLK